MKLNEILVTILFTLPSGIETFGMDILKFLCNSLLCLFELDNNLELLVLISMSLFQIMFIILPWTHFDGNGHDFVSSNGLHFGIMHAFNFFEYAKS